MFFSKLLLHDEGHICRHIPILTGVWNEWKGHQKDCLFCYKTFFLRLYFRDESHLYPKCLFDILTIYPKCYRFGFFSCGIGIYIPILTGVQNGHISRLKDSGFFAKKCPFWASFLCDEGHLYGNYLFYIPAIYRKYYRFHFFSRDLRMQISIIIVVQNEPESRRIDSVFLLKNVIFEASFR